MTKNEWSLTRDGTCIGPAQQILGRLKKATPQDLNDWFVRVKHLSMSEADKLLEEYFGTTTDEYRTPQGFGSWLRKRAGQRGRKPRGKTMNPLNIGPKNSLLKILMKKTGSYRFGWNYMPSRGVEVISFWWPMTPRLMRLGRGNIAPSDGMRQLMDGMRSWCRKRRFSLVHITSHDIQDYSIENIGKAPEGWQARIGMDGWPMKLRKLYADMKLTTYFDILGHDYRKDESGDTEYCLPNREECEILNDMFMSTAEIPQEAAEKSTAEKRNESWRRAAMAR